MDSMSIALGVVIVIVGLSAAAYFLHGSQNWFTVTGVCMPIILFGVALIIHHWRI